MAGLQVRCWQAFSDSAVDDLFKILLHHLKENVFLVLVGKDTRGRSCVRTILLVIQVSA